MILQVRSILDRKFPLEKTRMVTETQDRMTSSLMPKAKITARGKAIRA